MQDIKRVRPSIHHRHLQSFSGNYHLGQQRHRLRRERQGVHRFGVGVDRHQLLRVLRSGLDQCGGGAASQSSAYLQPLLHGALRQTAPSFLAWRTGMANMFFTNSGGEANECALKAARRYQHLHKGPDCYKIISMKNSFHGRSYGALSATGNPHYHEGFEPLVPGFKYAEFDNPENGGNPWRMRTAPPPSSRNAFRGEGGAERD